MPIKEAPSGLCQQRDPELFIFETKDFSDFVNPEDATDTYWRITRIISESHVEASDILFLALYNIGSKLQAVDKKIDDNHNILRERIDQFGRIHATQNGQKP